jgi:glycosyltransferase involved in cell wall biosynthesis
MVTAVASSLSVAFDATPLLGRPTGVGAFCVGTLAELARRSDLVMSAFVVSGRRPDGWESRLPTGVASGQRTMNASLLQALWSRVNHPVAERFIGRHDVVHGTNYVVPPVRHGARVVSVHDLTVVAFPELCDRAALAYPTLIRRAIADGAWVHTPSRFVADEVVDRLGADPARVRAVPYGVPALGSPEGPLPFPLPAGCGRYVLAIGTIEPRKDYPLLVRAMASVVGEQPDTALVIVGADGWGRAAFDEAVAAAPGALRSRIVRPGYLDDGQLARVLRSAAVLAYPSRYEGFGFPPLQAMAAGVPTVVTAAGSVPEVVGDGAFVVPVGDGAALASSILAALEGGEEIGQLVEQGKARSAEFTWEACASGLASLYRDASS